MGHTSVMTLAWNNQDYTKKFIQSVREHWHGSDYELLLLDNGSTDNTTPEIYKEVDGLIRLPANIGFGMGFNLLRKIARGKYLCLMNNDTEFVERPRWKYTDGLMFVTANNVLSPVNGCNQKQGGVTELEKFKLPTPSGVGMYISAELFDKVGGFSPEFGLASGEDSDLCFKVWEAGKPVIVNKNVWVQHEGKVSSKQLGNWQKLWQKNYFVLKDKWKKYI